MLFLRIGRRWLLVGVVSALVCLGQVVGHGATLFVANNGVDSSACGSTDNPCRSISQAISNAGTEDTVIVGPGRYGNLNDDDDFDDPGEEAAEVGSGCNCMIRIPKPLTILSSGGAKATLLDTGNSGVDVVDIRASGVAFGGKGKGFTLIAFNGQCLEISSGTSNVTVVGCIAANESDGFLIDGSGHNISANILVKNGIQVQGMGHTIQGNFISANDGDGITLFASNSVVSANLIIGNGYGIVVRDKGNRITGNSILGSTQYGIIAEAHESVAINGNNIYGSGVSGLSNESGGTVDASDNFWGSVNGPGPDPRRHLHQRGRWQCHHDFSFRHQAV